MSPNTTLPTLVYSKLKICIVFDLRMLITFYTKKKTVSHAEQQVEITLYITLIVPLNQLGET